MHDTMRKPGPKKVLWKNVFRSGRFQEIAIVGNSTAVRKVKQAPLAALVQNYLTLALCALRIAARKSRVLVQKPLGANRYAA